MFHRITEALTKFFDADDYQYTPTMIRKRFDTVYATSNMDKTVSIAHESESGYYYFVSFLL